MLLWFVVGWCRCRLFVVFGVIVGVVACCLCSLVVRRGCSLSACVAYCLVYTDYCVCLCGVQFVAEVCYCLLLLWCRFD